LVPHGIGLAASTAYRELRRVQHKARLNEEPTQVPWAMLEKERAAVTALWHAVFPSENGL
jgi:glutamate-ammonia-ligase adenylyltransferase